MVPPLRLRMEVGAIRPLPLELDTHMFPAGGPRHRPKTHEAISLHLETEEIMEILVLVATVRAGRG